jgi:hypothetical protein
MSEFDLVKLQFLIFRGEIDHTEHQQGTSLIFYLNGRDFLNGSRSFIAMFIGLRHLSPNFQTYNADNKNVCNVGNIYRYSFSGRQFIDIVN